MDILNWQKTLDEFKKKADEFQKAYSFLLSNPKYFANDAKLKTKREQLLKSGSVIKSGIETAASAVKAGNDMIKSVGSFFGLNALPVVLPLAAISASIAAIAYWLSDFDKLRGDIYTEMVESGTKPEKAAQILATIKPDQNGISNTLITNFLPLAGIAVVLWWVFGREK